MRVLFLLLAATCASCASAPECACASAFCIYDADGGGCEAGPAYCGTGEAQCPAMLNAVAGPVLDAGACVVTTQHGFGCQ